MRVYVCEENLKLPFVTEFWHKTLSAKLLKAKYKLIEDWLEMKGLIRVCRKSGMRAGNVKLLIK